ncbi:putative mitochondrial inner membrane protease subunit protein [Rosellinia necatrix]|uniref:Mitochondrial inner membrane protease subunit n=1 Tax=Rosellinia necatrix TaxID=77044 RepID=A0A1W2TWY6_ROSNE|nr:putative mitochondrial inner membrane protease subunit protein [Rosellinia necatrix]
MPFLGHPFRVLLATAQTFALAHVVWAYGFGVGFGWGPSMLPTFLAASEWFVTDRRCRRGRGVRVGDCVVYAIPVEPGEDGLKRVIGMPGDYVLLNSPPSSGSGSGSAAAGVVDRAGRGVGSENMIQVPKGHCYIVGDNLPWSRDSRDFGPIPLALIKGKVIAKGSLTGLNPVNWFTKVENGLQKPAVVVETSAPS